MFTALLLSLDSFIVGIQKEHPAKDQKSRGNRWLIQVHLDPIFKSSLKLFFICINGSPKGRRIRDAIPFVTLSTHLHSTLLHGLL